MEKTPGKLNRLRQMAKNISEFEKSDFGPAEYREMVRLIEELDNYQEELLEANEELRETQFQLERTHKKFFELYDQAPVGYLTLNTGGKIIQCNLTAAEMLGTVRARLIDEILSIFIHRDSLSNYLEKLRYVRESGENVWCELQLSSSVSKVEYVQLNIIPEAEAAEKDFNLWIAMTDITRAKRLEYERRDLHLELRKYSRELEAANRELEAFNDSVSHDLRAPLRSISAFTEMLNEESGDALDEKCRDYLNRIIHSVGHMGQIIEGLLALSRVSRAELLRRPVDLAEIAREIAAEIKNRNPERETVFMVPDNLVVEGDERMLRIVLDNLIGNAWKFTQTTNPARIELDEKTINGSRVIYLRDNGIGFDQRYGEKMFQPFKRLNSDKQYDGIGVGLAIVERVIKKHGGTIWAKGEKGEGAAFYFTIPDESRE